MVSNYMEGEWLVVFDDRAWTRNGGDKGDNSCFWKAAKVINCYWEDSVQIIDVRFIDDKKISRGHYLMSASSITPYWQEKIRQYEQSSS